ncbi:MAG: iron ABC transporter permease [Clostridia bacterium]|nr:iron ABC transporter permease [Clostridia bacterium]
MRNRRVLIPFLLALLALLCALSLLLGASGLSLRALLSALTVREGSAYAILVHIRLPRLLGALTAGACLSASGYILQSVLMNPLASPGVIGVNSGAGLAALLAMVFAPHAAAAVPAAAFAGALLAVAAVCGVSMASGASRSTLILSGVAISTLFSAVMDAVVTFYPDAAIGRTSFSIGGFESVTLARILSVAPFAVCGLCAVALLHAELSILSLGDEAARSLGLRANLFRMVFLALAALLAASAVSLGGLIGFVGLIAPHVSRQLLPKEADGRFAVCLLCGALLCVGCDLAARLLFAPYELPVGILLSLLGVPFFLFLLLTQKRRNRHAGS